MKVSRRFLNLFFILLGVFGLPSKAHDGFMEEYRRHLEAGELSPSRRPKEFSRHNPTGISYEEVMAHYQKASQTRDFSEVTIGHTSDSPLFTTCFHFAKDGSFKKTEDMMAYRIEITLRKGDGKLFSPEMNHSILLGSKARIYGLLDSGAYFKSMRDPKTGVQKTVLNIDKVPFERWYRHLLKKAFNRLTDTSYQFVSQSQSHSTGIYKSYRLSANEEFLFFRSVDDYEGGRDVVGYCWN